MTMCNSRGEDMVALARRIAAETGALALVRPNPPQVYVYSPEPDGSQGALAGVYYTVAQWEREAHSIITEVREGPHLYRFPRGAYIDAGDSEGGAP